MDNPDTRKEAMKRVMKPNCDYPMDELNRVNFPSLIAPTIVAIPTGVAHSAVHSSDDMDYFRSFKDYELVMMPRCFES